MEISIICPTCDKRVRPGDENCLNCGQMFCPACARPVGEDDLLCRACGEELVELCPGCGSEIGPDAILCPKCGLLLKQIDRTVVPEYTRFRIDAGSGTGEEEAFNGRCPVCETALFIEDGFCSDCGQNLCASCGFAVDEDEETCSNCGTAQFFDCPLCDFELMAGTEICPSCNALYPAFCPGCREELQIGLSKCPACRRGLAISQRSSARTIRSFIVGQKLVRMVACPECGKNFDPAAGNCSRCQSSVCGECQLILNDDERFCPRCGTSTMVVAQ